MKPKYLLRVRYQVSRYIRSWSAEYRDCYLSIAMSSKHVFEKDVFLLFDESATEAPATLAVLKEHAL